MAAPANSPDEERYAELLAAYDEALARGEPPTAPRPADTSPDLRRRLQQDQLILDLLERVWPRARPHADSGPSATTPDRKSPISFGRFEIRRELGRGGYGIVYQAFDPRLARLVALKVPHPVVLVTSDLRKRFLRESRAAACLDHPFIVPLYEAGEEGAICYMVSAYCEGPTLAAWLREQPTPVSTQRAARLVTQLAQAVEHAHRHGVLHRDLKPSNVLLQQTPDGLVPRITDFGLAKLLETQVSPLRAPQEADSVFSAASDSETSSSVLIGTPSYMAPEQTAASPERGPAIDIHALGVILYELLTGQTPYAGADPLETLNNIRSREPVPLRQRRPDVPAELETICLRCLRKQPHQRYPSAQALADDLQRWLRGERIQANPSGLRSRFVAWCRRPGRLLLAGLVALAIGVFSFLGYLVFVR